jgi:protein-S-isoprenylcysteine O-methyltransferase Ste14
VQRTTAVLTSAGWFFVTAGLGVVLVPWCLTGWRLPSPLPWFGLPASVGVVMIAVGLIPPLHVFAQFVRAGGTPVPGAMTERLVVSGFNRHVRNPIYLSAVVILLGEALLMSRLSVVLYALTLWIGVVAFVHRYEEPALARRFGSDYETYRRAVPAWLPRLHP